MCVYKEHVEYNTVFGCLENATRQQMKAEHIIFRKVYKLFQSHLSLYIKLRLKKTGQFPLGFHWQYHCS